MPWSSTTFPFCGWGGSPYNSLKKPEFAKLIPRKPERISYKYFSRSKEELLLLIYATDPRLASNQQILKLVKDLRGGSWGLVGTAAL